MLSTEFNRSSCPSHPWAVRGVRGRRVRRLHLVLQTRVYRHSMTDSTTTTTTKRAPVLGRVGSKGAGPRRGSGSRARLGGRRGTGLRCRNPSRRAAGAGAGNSRADSSSPAPPPPQTGTVTGAARTKHQTPTDSPSPQRPPPSRRPSFLGASSKSPRPDRPAADSAVRRS
jgi:hypothetical protein